MTFGSELPSPHLTLLPPGKTNRSFVVCFSFFCFFFSFSPFCFRFGCFGFLVFKSLFWDKYHSPCSCVHSGRQVSFWDVIRIGCGMHTSRFVGDRRESGVCGSICFKNGKFTVHTFSIHGWCCMAVLSWLSDLLRCDVVWLIRLTREM